MWLHHIFAIGGDNMSKNKLGIHKPFSITPKNAVVDQLLITYPTIIHCPYMCMCIYIYTYCMYIYVNIP